MPFLPPNQQRQSTEGISSTSSIIVLKTIFKSLQFFLKILFDLAFKCHSYNLPIQHNVDDVTTVIIVNIIKMYREALKIRKHTKICQLWLVLASTYIN